MRGEPGQGALDDPAARVYGEPSLLGRFAHDLDGGLSVALGL
jgi:hypothetical protein